MIHSRLRARISHSRRLRASRGYTLVEVVVAILVFTVGALAVAASSAVIAKGMSVDSVREHAARVATSRLESIRANCASATSGSEVIGGIRSEWALGASAGRVSVKESVTYQASKSIKTDTYELELSCP